MSTLDSCKSPGFLNMQEDSDAINTEAEVHNNLKIRGFSVEMHTKLMNIEVIMSMPGLLCEDWARGSG